MRLLRWFLFSVIISLVPLIFDGVLLWSRETPSRQIAVAVLAGGELLLISTAIAADAVGDLVGSGSTRTGLKLLVGGTCVISLLFAALWYAANSVLENTGQHANPHAVITGSAVVFICTVCAGASCKWLGEE